MNDETGQGKPMAAQDLLSDVRTLSVIGLGYIGLPTAAMFAASGLDVIGVDVSQRAVDSVNAGRAHIEEGDLDQLVQRCVGEGRLRAVRAPLAADVFIVAVPTPVGHDESRAPDLSYVRAAGRSIAKVLKRGDLVILESTSPVGTTEMLSALLADERPDLRFPHEFGDEADVRIAYCPERIIPGKMLQELIENDRIIGGITARCTEAAAQVYGRFVKGNCHRSNARTAEMVKLSENAFRDVNIAFANELSMVCADLGVDPWDVIGLANRHPRVSILNPGPGVGGHCIAVDPWFLVASSPERTRLIRTAREVNDAKMDFVLDNVEKRLVEDAELRVACFGLTYKPDVDDFRESPAFAIASTLSRRHPGRVLCVDPYASVLARNGSESDGLVFVDAASALASSDLAVLLVGHSDFRSIALPARMKLIDTVGFWR